MTDRYLALQVLMMPWDSNGVLTARAGARTETQSAIFGGVLLGYIDQAGVIGGRRDVILAGGEPPLLVTVAINRVEF